MNSHNEQEELDDLLSTVNQNEEEKEVPLQDLKGGVDKLSRKKFDFLYKRTAFRAMGEFFKQLFITFVKKHGQGNKKVHKNLKNHIQNFTFTVFSTLIKELNSS